MPKVAVLGFTPREEVLVNTLRSNMHGLEIGLFSGVANRALEERADHVHGTEDADLDFLKEWKADVVVIGPDKLSSNGMKERLSIRGVEAIGANSEQIEVETDRKLLRTRFPEVGKYYPPFQIFGEGQISQIRSCLREYGDYVVKYNGVYEQLGGGSKLSGLHLSSDDEAITFAKKSIKETGSVVIEKKVEGRDFSINALTAKDGSVFFFPENHCYKLRDTGDTGPNTSGTGSFAFGSRLPYMTDVQQTTARDICRELVAKINYQSEYPLVSGLNLDFRLGVDGNVYLFEMNARFAGAASLSTALALCGNDLYSLLDRAVRGSFDGVTAKAREIASVSVFTFPKFFPNDQSQSVVVSIPKAAAVPGTINCYTGWVHVLSEGADHREVELKNSTTQLFQTTGKSASDCRERLYTFLEGTPDALEYRTDIGKHADDGGA